MVLVASIILLTKIILVRNNHLDKQKTEILNRSSTSGNGNKRPLDKSQLTGQCQNQLDSLEQTFIKKYFTKIDSQQQSKFLQRMQISQHMNIESQKVQVDLIQRFLHQNQGKAFPKNLFQKKQGIQRVIQEERIYFEDKYQTWKQYEEQLGICVIVLGNTDHQDSDHSRELFRSINSIMQQQYELFHVTLLPYSQSQASFLKSYKKFFQLSEERFNIIEDNLNDNQMDSYQNAKLRKLSLSKYCSDGQILILLSTNDELIGRQVFNLMNSKFSSPNINLNYNQLVIANTVTQKPQVSENGQQLLLKSSSYQITSQNNQLDQRQLNPSLQNHFICFSYDLLKNIKLQKVQNDLLDNKMLYIFLKQLYAQLTLSIVGKDQILSIDEPLMKTKLIISESHENLMQQVRTFISQIQTNEMVSSKISLKTKQLTTYDLSDPVLKKQYFQKQKQKQSIQSIYSRQGTQITLDQFQQAKKRMKLLNLQQKLSQSQFDKISLDQKKYFQEKYPQFKLFESIEKQLSFCIIVPSYMNNHENKIFSNLDSILLQDYENYHVVYIDDFSSDGTSETVKRYMQDNEKARNKLKLITNKQNLKALQNIYHAAHNQCLQGQIMMIIDGDDYLLGRQVLRFLNSQYQTKNILCMYTNYLRLHYPYYLKVGTSTAYPQEIIASRTYRKSKIFRASHLRTFYVDLFRNIEEKDLKDDQGKFFTAANDFAIMMPVLQMSGDKFMYLSELMYVYDAGTGMNNFLTKQKVQKRNFQITRKRQPYKELQLEDFLFLTPQNYQRFQAQYQTLN